MIRLFLFIMISVMAAEGTSMAESISTCPVDTVPIKVLRKRGGGARYHTFHRQVPRRFSKF